MATPAEKASYARPYWNAATRHGEPNATTTFHTTFDKRDYHLSYGRVGDFPRQDGPRGLALGYLSRVRFVRFVSTPLAAELTGMDLSKPGQSGEQAARVNVVARELFDLLVRYSLSHPYRDGDYGNVARSRDLPHGSFCIFTGFAEALASKELKALRKAWKGRYTARLPSPPSPPSPVQARGSWRDAHIDDPADGRLERQASASFEAAQCTPASAESGFNASGWCVRHEEPLYFVQQVYRRRGARRGTVHTTLVLKGALRKRMRMRVLHSKQEIAAAFARFAGPSN